MRRASGGRARQRERADTGRSRWAKKRGSHRRTLSDEQRAEKRAAERELAAKAIEELRSSEGWQRWLSGRRQFHRYSFWNQLLIALQCPEASYVTGFRRWLELGYAVRKGEHGIRIWAPGPPSKRRSSSGKKKAATLTRGRVPSFGWSRYSIDLRSTRCPSSPEGPSI
ncbi:MAG: ArdC family protein [Thermoleophilia bacterium]